LKILSGDIFYYKNYYLDFFATLQPDVQQKFNWTLKLIATIERIPIKHFKHIEGQLVFLRLELK
jgi:hypothetical protein